MKPIAKATVISVVSGVLVYFIVAAVAYRNLLAHQPPHTPGGPWPKDFTSFPPSFAWVVAVPWGFFAVVVAFLLCLLVFALSGRRQRKP
jgi:hypothetical protein